MAILMRGRVEVSDMRANDPEGIRDLLSCTFGQPFAPVAGRG